MKKATLLAAVAASALIASPVLAASGSDAKNADAKMAPKSQMHANKKMKMKHARMHHSRAMHDRQAMATRQQQPGMFDDDWDAGWDRRADAGWTPGWDRRADAGWNRGTDTGFFPLDLATGVTAGAIGTAGAIAGGAVNTAGAVATAPFRDDWSPRRDSYAYYGAPMAVSTINGPTCQLGTWTTINGKRMRCQ